MAHFNSSPMHSSVRIYKNIEGLPSAVNNNFIKHLHLNHGFQRGTYEEERHPNASPLIKRHHSNSPFQTRYSYLQPQKPNAFHNRFVQYNQPPSPHRRPAQFANFQKQLLKLSAKQIAFNTEKQLFTKQTKRLKDQIVYLTEKCDDLQKKNQQLLGHKSRVQILDRQYFKLLRQYQRLKQSCKGYNNHYVPQHIPLSLQQLSGYNSSSSNFNNSSKINVFPKLQSKFLQGRQVSSRIVTTPVQKLSEKFNTKVAWKKVSGSSQSPSPIYKNEQRTFGKSPYDELPLIESKVEQSNSNEHGQFVRQEISIYNNYEVGREGARTIDLKEFDRQKMKQYEKKCQHLQQQVSQLRVKNIELYNQCEEIQKQKLMYLEAVNKMKYESARLVTEIKEKQIVYKKDFNDIKKQKKELQIKMMQLSEELNSSNTQLNLCKIGLEQYQLRQRQIKNDLVKLLQHRKQQKLEQKTKELQQKCSKIQAQFNKLRISWNNLNQKNNEIEIQKKVLEHQLKEKKQHVALLQKQAAELKASNSGLQKIVDQLDQESNNQKCAKQLKDSRQEDQNFVNLVKQLQAQRQENKIIIQDRWIYEQECKRLRAQNMFLNDNCAKLTKIFQLEKQENIRLNQLRSSWREIERKAKEGKRIDTAVDHLWQIKEVQYDNVHNILQHIVETLNTK